jgi:hypothetical protein
MVVDHSAGVYSLNSMIDPKDIAGVKLDGIVSLGTSLRAFRHTDPTSELQMFKSDVCAAYRQMPMHPLFQILTIITVNGERRVDRCNNFGNRGSQKIWQSFMSLVVWILVFKRGLKQLKCYVDDIFSFSKVDDIVFYRPYSRYMPTNQVKVLQLWDEIGLPHEDGKQISGRIIPCIGFDVDPNLMTVSMNPEKRATLMRDFRFFWKTSVTPRLPTP